MHKVHGRAVRAVLVGLVALACVGLAPSPAPAVDPPPPFVTQGSVEQLAVTHAPPGATVELRDAATASPIPDATADAFGSHLFRDLTPGEYVVAVTAGATTTESEPVTVLDDAYVPPQSFYDSQVLHEGFGYLTTRDGTKLSVTVHLPGPPDQGPYPTVVEYSGYSPSDPSSPQPSTLVAQLLGYATVGVNMRGTGCSGGSFMYFEELQSLDGYDVVETVAAQPWVAHGKVGMVGISYPGISQLFVARTQPPHLAAIAPLSVIADTYRSTLYPGGIFNDGFALDWAKGRENDAKPYGQGGEKTIVAAGGADGAQCAENQLLRLQNPDLEQLIAQNAFYEKERGDALSPVTFVDRIDVPTFMAGAWQDEQTGGHFPVMWDRFSPSTRTRFTATNGLHVDSWLTELNRWYEFLELYVAHRIPKVPPLVRALAPLLVESQTGISGVQLEPDRFTGYATYEEALAAYEAEPPVRVMFENGGSPAAPGAPIPTFEHSFSQWPPAETVPTTWWFQPDQRLSRRRPHVRDGDGKATTSYVYDPTAKPRTDYHGSGSDIWKALPDWQWKPLPLGKALAFDSDPLTAETVMVGHGSVDLWLRSTAPDTDLEVTLSELRPDGQEVYVQNGWLRASHRRLDPSRSTLLRPWQTHLAADAEPLTPGVLTPVRVELFPFAHVFRPGSRLRISVEAPGGNRPFWTFDALPGTAVDEIGHSVHHASRVVLPVVPGIDAPDAPPPCPSLRGQPCRPAYGDAAPVRVRARLGAGPKRRPRPVIVTWRAPATVRPGDTITGYRIAERPGGTVAEVGAGARSAVVLSLPAGRHTFTVEVVYANGSTSGVSTPSNTVLVPATETSRRRVRGRLR